MKFKYLQDGGQISAEEAAMNGGQQGAAAPEQGSAEQAIQEFAAQLVEMLMQQVQDPAAVSAILQAALEMVEGAAQQQAPVYQRNGGRVRRLR